MGARVGARAGALTCNGHADWHHAPAHLAQVLRDTRHNGFPIVRDTPGGQVLMGLVNREHLMVILRRSLAAGARNGADAGDVSYEDLNRHFVSAAARSLISEQQLAVLQVGARVHACDYGSCCTSKAWAGVCFRGPFFCHSGSPW